MTSELAADVVRELTARGLTVATAESLTGGGLGETLTSAPGASAAYVGGVICYATRVKVELLGVPLDIVHEDGVVSERCARAMAAGARRVLAADLGVSTTGVAGPDRQEGKPVGTVYVALADADGEEVQGFRLAGDRTEVRAGTTQAALAMLVRRISAIR